LAKFRARQLKRKEALEEKLQETVNKREMKSIKK
jgi:DNA excision repair protein ERCC-6